jgi:site-specific DNA-methyltransferase (adenine-specific)
VSDTLAAAVWEPIGSIHPWAGNPRVNAKAIDAVAKSIARFGFADPIVCNGQEAQREVIAGHTRLLAAKKLGLKEVPVRWLSLSDSEAHALNLASNRLGELAEWDDAALAKILADLKAEDPASVLDLGWDEAAIARILAPLPDLPPALDPDAIGAKGKAAEDANKCTCPQCGFEFVK